MNQSQSLNETQEILLEVLRNFPVNVTCREDLYALIRNYLCAWKRKKSCARGAKKAFVELLYEKYKEVALKYSSFVSWPNRPTPAKVERLLWALFKELDLFNIEDNVSEYIECLKLDEDVNELWVIDIPVFSHTVENGTYPLVGNTKITLNASNFLLFGSIKYLDFRRRFLEYRKIELDNITKCLRKIGESQHSFFLIDMTDNCNCKSNILTVMGCLEGQNNVIVDLSDWDSQELNCDKSQTKTNEMICGSSGTEIYFRPNQEIAMGLNRFQNFQIFKKKIVESSLYCPHANNRMTNYYVDRAILCKDHIAWFCVADQFFDGKIEPFQGKGSSECAFYYFLLSLWESGDNPCQSTVKRLRWMIKHKIGGDTRVQEGISMVLDNCMMKS
jgi:hypothetical protein